MKRLERAPVKAKTRLPKEQCSLIFYANNGQCCLLLRIFRKHRGSVHRSKRRNTILRYAAISRRETRMHRPDEFWKKLHRENAWNVILTFGVEQSPLFWIARVIIERRKMLKDVDVEELNDNTTVLFRRFLFVSFSLKVIIIPYVVNHRKEFLLFSKHSNHF